MRQATISSWKMFTATILVLFLFSCNDSNTESKKNTESEAATPSEIQQIPDSNNKSTTDTTKYDTTKTEQNPPAIRRIR